MDGAEILGVIPTCFLPHPSCQQRILQIWPPRWILNLSTSLPSTAITEPSRLTWTIATTSFLVSLLHLLPCNHPFSLSSPSDLFKTQIQSGSCFLKPFLWGSPTCRTKPRLVSSAYRVLCDLTATACLIPPPANAKDTLHSSCRSSLGLSCTSLPLQVLFHLPLNFSFFSIPCYFVEPTL